MAIVVVLPEAVHTDHEDYGRFSGGGLGDAVYVESLDQDFPSRSQQGVRILDPVGLHAVSDRFRQFDRQIESDVAADKSFLQLFPVGVGDA